MGNNNYNQDPSDSSYTNRVATNNNHRDDRFDHPIFSALSTSKIPPEAFQRAALANAPFALGTTARGFTNATGNNTSKQTKAFAAHKNQQNAFLYELFDIVSDPINKDIISWLSHGRGFIINNKNLFEKNILPHFLPNTKYASFTRRLKRWKFTR